MDSPKRRVQKQQEGHKAYPTKVRDEVRDREQKTISRKKSRRAIYTAWLQGGVFCYHALLQFRVRNRVYTSILAHAPPSNVGNMRLVCLYPVEIVAPPGRDQRQNISSPA